jgi:hypothetical protein
MYSAVATHRAQLLQYPDAVLRAIDAGLFKPHTSVHPGRPRATYARAPEIHAPWSEAHDLAIKRIIATVDRMNDASMSMPVDEDWPYSLLHTVLESADKHEPAQTAAAMRKVMYPMSYTQGLSTFPTVREFIAERLPEFLDLARTSPYKSAVMLGVVAQGHAVAIAAWVRGDALKVGVWDPISRPGYTDDQYLMDQLRKKGYNVINLATFCEGGKCVQYHINTQQCYVFCTWFALCWCAACMRTQMDFSEGSLKLILQDAAVIPGTSRAHTPASVVFQLVMLALMRLLLEASHEEGHTVASIDALGDALHKVHGLPKFPTAEGRRTRSTRHALDNSAPMPRAYLSQRLSLRGATRV